VGRLDRFEDPVGDASEEAPRAERIAVVRPVHRQQVRTERPEGRVLAHAGRHLADRCEGDVTVLGSDRSTIDAEAGRDRLPDRRPNQPRLAQPCLAGQEERLTAALGGLADQIVGELEQVVAPTLTGQNQTRRGSWRAAHDQPKPASAY
jgi:hypothetical protein